MFSVLALLREDKEISGGSSIFRFPRTEDRLFAGEAESDESSDIKEVGRAELASAAATEGGTSTLEMLLFAVRPWHKTVTCSSHSSGHSNNKLTHDLLE